MPYRGKVSCQQELVPKSCRKWSRICPARDLRGAVPVAHPICSRRVRYMLKYIHIQRAGYDLGEVDPTSIVIAIIVWPESGQHPPSSLNSAKHFRPSGVQLAQCCSPFNQQIGEPNLPISEGTNYIGPPMMRNRYTLVLSIRQISYFTTSVSYCTTTTEFRLATSLLRSASCVALITTRQKVRESYR